MASEREKVVIRLNGFGSDGQPRSITAQIQAPGTECPAQRCPAFMIFGGFETAHDVLNLVKRKVPFYLATFDYPFSGKRQFSFPQTIQEAPELKSAIPRTLEGIQALYEALKRKSEIDPNNIGIIGASFGAPFAAEAAVREPGISSLVLIHGFVDIQKIIEYRLEQTLKEKMPLGSSFLAQWIARGIVFYLEPPRPDLSFWKLDS